MDRHLSLFLFSVIENVDAQTNNVNSSLELSAYVLMVFSAGKHVSSVSDFDPRYSDRILWLVPTVFNSLRLFIIELLKISEFYGTH